MNIPLANFIFTLFKAFVIANFLVKKRKGEKDEHYTGEL